VRPGGFSQAAKGVRATQDSLEGEKVFSPEERKTRIERVQKKTVLDRDVCSGTKAGFALHAKLGARFKGKALMFSSRYT
jgi:hypothetical protein